MSLPPRSRYTLLVPTYNRSALLRSLLGYLAARRFEYPIRILDSSYEQALSENRQTIERAGLDITHQVYDPAVPVGTKFALGAESVETPYCSFCADDDILFTGHLGRALDLLDADHSAAGAHGHYVNFKHNDNFDISDLLYWAPSIAGDDALKRIVEQMGNYQAIFYAIYRTSVLQSKLRQAKRGKSNLAIELLMSAAALAAGGVHRLPHFHMARNTGPSMVSEGWHPYQFLASNPELLFSEYAEYRAIVLEHLLADERCRGIYTPAQMERVLDLVHLKYLAPMISGPVLDRIIEESLGPDGKSQAISPGAWKEFTISDRKPEGLKGLLVHLRRALSEPHRAGMLLGYLRRLAGLRVAFKFGENLEASMGRRLGDMVIDRETRDGRRRRYLLSREFLNHDIGDGRRVPAAAIRSMIEQLDDYVPS
jgi:glycosyltransferase domain-containing protein